MSGDADTNSSSAPHQLERRRAHVPRSRAEAVIVPLVATAVEQAILAAARSSSAPGRALDVGCGGQPFRAALEETGYRYFSMDVAANGAILPDFIGPLDATPAANLISASPFDLVLCTEVLEHVADWAMAFHNLSTFTKTRGRLIISSPMFYHLHEQPFDFWRPTSHALRHYAQNSHFRELSIQQLGSPFEVLSTLLGSVDVFPASTTLASRLGSTACRFVSQKISGLIRRGWAQRLIVLKGDLYLSNVAVFEKT